MNTVDFFSSVAEVSVTLAGFAAVFRAFRGEHADAHSQGRTMLVIEMGLLLVALCYLPTLLTRAGLDLSLGYRIVSALCAVYWLRWLVLASRMRNEIHATPVLYKVAVCFHIGIFAAFASNVPDLFGDPEGIYVLTSGAILVLVAMAFLAQFRAEAAA